MYGVRNIRTIFSSAGNVMLISNTHLDTLKTCIEREVFVTRAQEYFFPEGGRWIMDFRRVCLDPRFLDAYTEVFYERYQDRFPFQVGGMEVAAIPLVTAIVMKMRERGKPINGFFIRKSRKKSGLLRMIEGSLTDDPVILVDDLINNGYTLDRQLKVLAEAGKTVSTFFTLLRFRAPEAYHKYTPAGVAIDGLFGLDEFTHTLGTQLLTPPVVVPQENFTVQWYFKAKNPKLESVVPKSGAVFDRERIYVGTDRGVLYALDRRTGKVVWEHRIGFGPWANKRDKVIFSTPVLHDGRIFFGAFDGNLYCLDAKTGKRLWVSFEADWIEGGVAVAGRAGLIVVPILAGTPHTPGGVVALDLHTGQTRWRITLPARTTSTPLSIEDLGLVLVATEQGTVYALNDTTGQKVWSFQTMGAVRATPAYVAQQSVVIVASYDGSVYALDVRDGLLRWRFDIGLANHASPCIDGARVFIASLDKHLYALDLSTGKQLWSFPCRARIFASPKVYAGRLYCGANDARLYELDPATGKQTGYFQAVERITNPLLYDPDTEEYFLVTYANELLCLKRHEAAQAP